ncbi:hypothetical protein pneo_cds_412 [Pandoravirus neocaledonia]|uniref:Uncharacterized protein n=1 Tax=Pandoravirus neocaledonia TaxID=2107708 RepID=A0A2U7UC29_9VIRU|nr:hypothetical protein pneo_cds_412 [Pandoravirus neocaledonia]AVK76019.1 hypothetical protein pneo_cds_412 [Pandoravirus neocaledonia]
MKKTTATRAERDMASDESPSPVRGNMAAPGPLAECGMCLLPRVTKSDRDSEHMLFTTDGSVWDICARCVAKTDMTAVGCGRCLGPAVDLVDGRAGAAISANCGDSVVAVCDACFPYDLDNDR